MSLLEKNILTSVLGKRAGTKLYSWLNPCCGLVFRTETTCIGGQICVSIYGTSPINQTLLIQGGIDLDTYRISANKVYTFTAGQEILLVTECASSGNPPEGTYPGFVVGVISGEPVLGYILSVDVPFCDA